MGTLHDRVAIVTGASRGIGQAIAATFAREGASVVICGRRQDALETVASELGERVIPVQCHVGRAEDIRRLVDRTRELFGRVDLLVNNAATNIAQEPALDIDEAKFDKMVEINLKSAFRLIQAVAPGMCEQRRGSVINVASISGLRPQYEGMLYSMTKAALLMMTQSYALELGRFGVRVNAIAPGFIQTQLSEYYWKGDGRIDELVSKQALQRLGQPSDVAQVALLLASEGGSYITGQTFVVDGGRLIQ